MYNPNIDPKINEAKFTKLFNDIQTNPALLAFYSIIQEDYEDVLSSYEINMSEGYENLKQEILEKYRYYEICDSDISVFVQCMNDVFHQYKHEYIQLARNYYKEYNYEVGNRKRTIRKDTSESNRDSSSANVNTVSDKRYDLPHKQVSDTEAKGYMTERSDTDNKDENASNVQSQASLDSNVETIYDNEFLDLKRKYLNQIRNINDEFADKFSDCFIHIFG